MSKDVLFSVFAVEDDSYLKTGSFTHLIGGCFFGESHWHVLVPYHHNRISSCWPCYIHIYLCAWLTPLLTHKYDLVLSWYTISAHPRTPNSIKCPKTKTSVFGRKITKSGRFLRAKKVKISKIVQNMFFTQMERFWVKKKFFSKKFFWIIQNSQKTEAGIFHEPLKLCGWDSQGI